MKAVKTMKSVQEADLSGLGEVLEDFPLDIAVLFGSVTASKTHGLSDLDVAIRFKEDVEGDERLSLLDEITAKVIQTAGFSAVDLVDIDQAPPSLAYRALDRGRLLVGDDKTVTHLKERILVRKLDFHPVKKSWQEALSQRLGGARHGA